MPSRFLHSAAACLSLLALAGPGSAQEPATDDPSSTSPPALLDSVTIVGSQAAARRTLRTLRFLWTAPQGDASTGMIGTHGLFYHFVDPATGQRFGTVELSTVDTALLLAGAVAGAAVLVARGGDDGENGEDEDGERLLRPERQDVPSKLFHVVPKGWIWPGMWCAFHFGFVPMVNAMKYRAGYKEALASPYPQTHGAFHFLLDYVPNWKKMYRPGGLIQHQSFVPVDAAETVFRTQLELCRKRGSPSFLGVLKRHRPDDCLMGHGVDGFSLALDFPVVDRRRAELALHGIESQIQRVMIDDRTYHRVRIGPTDDLDELNLLRSRLRAAQIDVLRIRLGD